jgi:hypothetical protein
MSAVFMFDKVLEGISVGNMPLASLNNVVDLEFIIATVCLYMAAKFEDPKYPYFESYRDLVIDKATGYSYYRDAFLGYFLSRNKDE